MDVLKPADEILDMSPLQHGKCIVVVTVFVFAVRVRIHQTQEQLIIFNS